jgi:hypothetical protein
MLLRRTKTTTANRDHSIDELTDEEFEELASRIRYSLWKWRAWAALVLLVTGMYAVASTGGPAGVCGCDVPPDDYYSVVATSTAVPAPLSKPSPTATIQFAP